MISWKLSTTKVDYATDIDLPWLLWSCIYGGGDIVWRLYKVIGGNRGLLGQFTFDLAAFRDQLGNNVSI